MTRRSLAAKFLLVAALSLLPIAANAQSALTGVVKDTSGAVLPGVTVEAASPALIEKTRSTVTDESGGFKIVDLRPGVYSLTFTLEGFSTVKREGLELPSNFTMTVNIDLKVGALEETLTRDPIGRPDDGTGSSADVLHHPRSHCFVIPRELELRDGLVPGGRRPERLIRI